MRTRKIVGNLSPSAVIKLRRQLQQTSLPNFRDNIESTSACAGSGTSGWGIIGKVNGRWDWKEELDR